MNQMSTLTKDVSDLMAEKQAAITGTCPTNQAISAVKSDGSVDCLSLEPDFTEVYVMESLMLVLTHATARGASTVGVPMVKAWLV